MHRGSKPKKTKGGWKTWAISTKQRWGRVVCSKLQAPCVFPFSLHWTRPTSSEHSRTTYHDFCWRRTLPYVLIAFSSWKCSTRSFLDRKAAQSRFYRLLACKSACLFSLFSSPTFLCWSSIASETGAPALQRNWKQEEDRHSYIQSKAPVALLHGELLVFLKRICCRFSKYWCFW